MEFVLELLNEQKKLLSIELGECEGEEHKETKRRLEQVTYAINLLSSQNAKDVKAKKDDEAWEKYRQTVYDASPKEICKCETAQPMYNSEPEFCSGCGNQIIGEEIIIDNKNATELNVKLFSNEQKEDDKKSD